MSEWNCCGRPWTSTGARWSGGGNGGPVGAIHDRGGGPGVWIVDEKSEVHFRPVTIASIGQEQVVLSSGVQFGEQVVALGAHLLHEGQVVNVANDEKKEKPSYAKF